MKKTTAFSRVLQGSLRGKKIPIPRPIASHQNITTQKIKETVFNIITNYFQSKEAVFCDLFSGSGQIGIEAISRGFGCTIFCEKDRTRFQQLKLWLNQNSPNHSFILLHKNGESSLKYILSQQPVDLKEVNFSQNIGSAPRSFPIHFDNLVIFVDPPYFYYEYNKFKKIIQKIYTLEQKVEAQVDTENPAKHTAITYQSILYLAQTPAKLTFSEQNFFEKRYQYGNHQILTTHFKK